MAVLVTGGAGYIGSQMVHELLDAGERVVVLDDLSTGFRWAVPENVHFAVGDSGDQALLTRLLREHAVNAVIHFAACIVVPDSVRDPLRYYRNNTANSRALIEAAIQCEVRHFIFSSTAAVYGSPAAVPVDEDAPTQPISPYGWSKLMTEIMLRDTSHAHSRNPHARNDGFNHVILRYFNVARPARPRRPVERRRNPLDQSRRRNRAGIAPKSGNFWHHVPNPGWDLHSRLHSRQRSCRSTRVGIAPPPGRRSVVDTQLRLWSRFFGSRGD